MANIDEVWVVGATGRTGRRVVTALVERGARVVVVGRRRAALDALVRETGAERAIEAADVAMTAELIRDERPPVVVNTVGPFAETALPLAEACLPHSSYADLANDTIASSAILALHERAMAAGRTLVTGAGFGVVGTEAPLTALCANRPNPVAVRVDAMASLALPATVMGGGLAKTIIDIFVARAQRITAGVSAPVGIGSYRERVALPDGSSVMTGAWQSGDLVVAQRVSRATEIVAASSEVPTALGVRLVLPLVRRLLAIASVRRFAVRRIAGIRSKERPMPRPHSWGRARAEWNDGTVGEAWLEAGDAYDFTAQILAETAFQTLNKRAKAGAGSPIQMLGLDLVKQAGGTLIMQIGDKAR